MQEINPLKHERERESERESGGRVVRHTIFTGKGEGRKIFGYEDSRAVPARPFGEGRLKRK
jgi:hypothetical protein